MGRASPTSGVSACCIAKHVSSFLFSKTKYPTSTAYRRSVLFGWQFPVGLVHGWLALRQKQNGGSTQAIVARNKRERDKNTPSRSHPLWPNSNQTHLFKEYSSMNSSVRWWVQDSHDPFPNVPSLNLWDFGGDNLDLNHNTTHLLWEAKELEKGVI